MSKRSVAAQAALAATLTGEGALALGGAFGQEELPLEEVLDAALGFPLASRLPLRG